MHVVEPGVDESNIRGLKVSGGAPEAFRQTQLHGVLLFLPIHSLRSCSEERTRNNATGMEESVYF